MERVNLTDLRARLRTAARKSSHALRIDRMPAWLRILVTVALGVLLLAVLFDVGTASPAVCRGCHEMDVRIDSWESSAHSVVRCVECHQPPTAWYELPTRVADRAMLLAHDTKAHFASGFDGEAIDALPTHAEPISDEVCLSCHDPNREATSGYRIKIDHVEHAKRNGSCSSCHVRTAHPRPTRGTPLTLMGQCYTCHGTPEYADAPSECNACHPDGYKLLPESHESIRWARGHGDTSEEDAKLCSMCHKVAFCDDCHGIGMPHPAQWEEGESGHADAARRDADVCARCHDGGPDMCTMCHHTSYEPMKGAWVDQHPIEVRDEGQEYCLSCHEQRYCSYCHTRIVEDGTTE